MPRRKSVNAVGRLGARYGRSLRKRLNQIEVEMGEKQRCPSCTALKVTRISVGVWKCAKCDFTFSGGAYTASSMLGQVAKRSIRRGYSS